MHEVLWHGRDKTIAEEIAIECENFLAIPMVVKRTWLDLLTGRWRVVCERQHLADGFRWEMDAPVEKVRLVKGEERGTLKLVRGEEQ